MKAREVRKRSTPDLREELRRLDREGFEHRFRSHSEEKPDRGFVRRTRRERARILTILRERGDSREAPAGTAPVEAAAAPAAAGRKGAKRRKEKAS